MTLVRVVPADPESSAACRDIAPELEQDIFVQLEVAEAWGEACICSALDFVWSLDLDKKWDVAWLLLSERRCPYPHSAGKLKASMLQEPRLVLWNGVAAETQRGGRLHHLQAEFENGDALVAGDIEGDLEENAGISDGFEELLQSWSSTLPSGSSGSEDNGSSSSSSTSSSSTSSDGDAPASLEGETAPSSTRII